jgi:hypothetical protein
MVDGNKQPKRHGHTVSSGYASFPVPAGYIQKTMGEASLVVVEKPPTVLQIGRSRNPPGAPSSSPVTRHVYHRCARREAAAAKDQARVDRGLGSPPIGVDYFNEEVIVHNSQEARAGESAIRPSGLSRRSFIRVGATAAGLTAVGLPSVGLAGPAFAAPGKPGAEVPFGPVTVVADGGFGASYARAVRLSTAKPGGYRALLATYQGGSFSSFPIYRSEDDGRTWAQQSAVPDAADRAPGLYLQPSLYELPRPFAGLPKGALLFACNFWPFDLTTFTIPSTNIQLYASTDAGLTWDFLSTVAQGGPPDTTNGATPVWEPFLLLHKDKLICYYSDQRDPNWGQKLSHQTSTDLGTWGPVVDDATGMVYAQRPGMTTVAQLKEDLWIMTYEFGDPDPDDSTQWTYHVHYRIAKDPESFRFSQDTPLLDQDGHAPNASPVVSWSDSGGHNGTIVVTANDDQDFFINRDLGDPGKWTRLSSPMPNGYSRFTIPLDDPGQPKDPGLVFVVTGPTYNDAFNRDAPHAIQAGIISLDSDDGHPGSRGPHVAGQGLYPRGMGHRPPIPGHDPGR